MTYLYWIQEARNIKSENNKEDDGDVTVTNIEKLERICYIQGKKGQRKNALRKPRRLKKAR